MSSETSEADRLISSQPVEYIGPDGFVKYNKRKLTELPNCLANINSGYALSKACELVFYNYEFMHAKFVCESSHEILEDLNRVLEELSSWSFQSETKSDFQQLNILKKLMTMIGVQIEDYPDSFAFQFTSRFLGFYSQQKHVKYLIDACDEQSIKHCSFVSPYLQQELPGGFLLASISKSGNPILESIMIIPFFITHSHSNLLIYSILGYPVPKFVTEVKLPKLTELFTSHKIEKTKLESINFNSRNEISKLKCLITSNLQEYLSRETDVVKMEITNPDLIPLLFMVIFRHCLYVVAPNKQIKFVYFTESEIIDACFWGDKSLVIVEKNSLSLKIFTNFEKDPKNIKNFFVSNQSLIKEACISKNNIFLTTKSTLLLTLMLHSEEVRQYLFRYDPVEATSNSDSYSSDTSAYGLAAKLNFFSSTSDYETNDETKSFQKINFSNSLSIISLDLIKCCGLKIFKILQPLSTSFQAIEEKESKHYVTYLSTADGSLILLKNEKKRCRVKIYKNLTKQPIFEIKFGFDGNTFSLRAAEYFYILQRNKNIDELENKEFFKLEIKEEIDLIQPLSENIFFVCKRGIIELYKYEIQEKQIKSSLAFSINTLSRNVTDMIFIGEYYF